MSILTKCEAAVGNVNCQREGFRRVLFAGSTANGHGYSPQMRARAHIILFLLCLAGTIAIYYLGLVWNLADFHPSSDVIVSPDLTQRAETGAKMTRLFVMPTMALSKAIGDDGSLLTLVPVFICVLVALCTGLSICCCGPRSLTSDISAGMNRSRPKPIRPSGSAEISRGA